MFHAELTGTERRKLKGWHNMLSGDVVLKECLFFLSLMCSVSIFVNKAVSLPQDYHPMHKLFSQARAVEGHPSIDAWPPQLTQVELELRDCSRKLQRVGTRRLSRAHV